VLGVKYRPIEGGIELADRPIVFKVFAASLGGVVGGTWILGICDELARWRDSDSGQNPASQVLASLRPTMATQPKAKLFLSSSPLGELDAHFDAMALGDTTFQRVATAETWIANPTITEEETHSLEPDEAIWSREYAAIPSAELETSLYTAFEIDRATRKTPLEVKREHGTTYEAAMDPATRGDRWTLAIGALRMVDNRIVRSIVAVRSWQGTRSAPLDPRRVLSEIATVLMSYGITSVWSDQGGGGDTMVSLGDACGLSVCLQPTTVVNKREMFESLKEQLRAGDVELPPDPQVRADLLAVRKRITRNGISIELPHVNGSHADYAPALALLASKLVVEPHIEHVPTADEQREAARRARADYFRAEAESQNRWWDRRPRGSSPYDRDPWKAAFSRRG
jgi:hypothetical protein